jgi:hypothetical protein
LVGEDAAQKIIIGQQFVHSLIGYNHDNIPPLDFFPVPETPPKVQRASQVAEATVKQSSQLVSISGDPNMFAHRPKSDLTEEIWDSAWELFQTNYPEADKWEKRNDWADYKNAKEVGTCRFIDQKGNVFCLACKRTHEHENAKLKIKGENLTLFFCCMRTDKEIVIGDLNPKKSEEPTERSNESSGTTGKLMPEPGPKESKEEDEAYELICQMGDMGKAKFYAKHQKEDVKVVEDKGPFYFWVTEKRIWKKSTSNNELQLVLKSLKRPILTPKNIFHLRKHMIIALEKLGCTELPN